MSRRSGNRRIALALGLSLALHALLLMAAPSPFGSPTAWPTQERRSIVAVRLTPEPPPEPEPERKEPEPERKDIELGLDAPNPPSTTWLGFLEYAKHLAMKGEVEQAAFTDDPVAAAPPAPPAPTTPNAEQPAPAREAMAQAEPQPQPDPALEPQPPTEPELPPARAQPAATPAIEAPIERPEAPEAPIERPVLERPLDTPLNEPGEEDVNREAPPKDDAEAEAERDIESASERGEAEPRPSPMTALAMLANFVEAAREAMEQQRSQVAPTPPTQTPPMPAVAPRPLAGAPNAGAHSDRESDPSSIIDVPKEQWKEGKPLAAHGLEIKPRKPDMPILTSLTAWPANPLCRISFDRAGVPARAVILQSTGDSRVDSAIEASLYRWRAAGRQLDELRPGQMVDLTIRLLINPARRAENKDEG